MNSLKKFMLAAVPLFVSVNLFAYTRIYILPEVEISGNSILISDICRIEGTDAADIGTITVPPDKYSDGIIDRKEIRDLLVKNHDSAVFVHGNGARITFLKISNETERVKDILVRKGDQVTLVVRRNGIRIELEGRALCEGGEGDSVDISLKRGKIVKGIVAGERKVLIGL